MRLAYVTLQSTTQGQAAHAHVHEILRGLERRGVRTTLSQVNYRTEPSSVQRLWECLRVQALAWRAFQSADVVYIRLHFLTFLSVLMSSLLRKSIVIEVNGTFADTYMAYPVLRRVRRAVEWCERFQLKRADVAICVTDNLAEWVASLSPTTSTTVITNGANVEVFSNLRLTANSATMDLPREFVVFFGALSKWQGVKTMLEATRCPEWPSDIPLVIVGDGADRGLVEAELQRSDSRVIYLGQQDYAAVANIVSRSLASLIVKEGPFSEGGLMPLKLFESLACEVPVVVTDYPGIADVVAKHDLGVVINPHSPRELALSIDQFRAWDETRRGGLRRWVLEGNSWDARAQETHDCLVALESR